jgi:hypothetical protein
MDEQEDTSQKREDKLKQGHYYTINLVKPYTKYGPLFVQFNAICKKESMELYGNFSIRDAFFSDVGLNTYLTLVTEDTDLYISNLITSTDPIKVDTGNSIFIPDSIIDYNNIEEWFVVKRFKYDISGVSRYLPSLTDQRDFINNSEKSIQESLYETDILAGDLVGVSNTQTEFLQSQSDIKVAEEYRARLLKERDARNFEQFRRKEEEFLYIYKEKNNIMIEKNNIVKERQQVQVERNELNEIRMIHNIFLSKTDLLKYKYFQTYQLLFTIANQLGQSIMSWEQIWAQYIGEGSAAVVKPEDDDTPDPELLTPQ